MPFPLHFRKNFRHRVTVHPQKPGELPHGRQLGSDGQLPGLDKVNQLRLELGVNRKPVLAIEFEIHLIVLLS
jgi:hypothetical protein